MKNIGAEKPAAADRPRGTAKSKTVATDDDKPAAGTIGDLIKEKLGKKLEDLKKTD
jgi:small subunit ribosomal protein S1